MTQSFDPGNPFGEYLYELSAQLRPHLPTELRHQRVEEIRTHLAMDLEARLSAGESVDEAARNAKRSLGSPSLLARQMIRQARGYDSASAWRLTFAPGIAIALSFVIPFAFGIAFGDTDAVSLAMLWLPFLALCGFGLLVLRTRRWLAGPTTVWVSVILVAMVLTGQAASRKLHPVKMFQIENLSHELQEAEHQERLIRTWQASKGPLQEAPVSMGAQPTGFTYLPFIPINFIQSRECFILKKVTPTESAELWARNGPGFASVVPQELDELRAKLEAFKSGFRAPWTPVDWVFICVLEPLAVLLGVNAICLGLLKVQMVRKTIRDPLLA